MTEETWKEFKAETYLRLLDPQKYNEGPYLNSLYARGIKFIENLLRHKVPLDQINLNDWNANSAPGIYVGIRKYSRLAKNDYKLALKYLGRKLIKGR